MIFFNSVMNIMIVYTTVNQQNLAPTQRMTVLGYAATILSKRYPINSKMRLGKNFISVNTCFAYVFELCFIKI